MSDELTQDQTGAVTMLLQSGKTIKEIVKFAELDLGQVTKVARTLDFEPATEVQRLAKQLYASPEGHTFQEIAMTLANQGHTAPDEAPMHHLTVASWVKNYGWPWGGALDGDYAPDRPGTPAPRSKYTLRLSKTVDAEINAPAQITAAADLAWAELAGDKTHIVQLAIIRAAARVGVTNLTAIKKTLLERHGDELRNAKQ